MRIQFEHAIAQRFAQGFTLLETRPTYAPKFQELVLQVRRSIEKAR
jgi:hypothetical protein